MCNCYLEENWRRGQHEERTSAARGWGGGGGHQLFLTDTVFEFSDVVTWWLTTRHYIYHLFCTLIFVIINTLRKRNELLFCVLLFRTEPSDLSINLQKSPIRTFFSEGMQEQRRLRSDCASAHSDQSLSLWH